MAPGSVYTHSSVMSDQESLSSLISQGDQPNVASCVLHVHHFVECPHSHSQPAKAHAQSLLLGLKDGSELRASRLGRANDYLVAITLFANKMTIWAGF